MHEGHRERVREKYKLNGLDGFADHEVLELLLFYANKRCDTNATAHRLIDAFGSLSAVMEASYDELIKIDGVGDVAATLITLVPNLFRRYTQDKAGKVQEINTAEQAKEYLMPKFYGLSVEKTALLSLDAQNRINNFCFIHSGSVSFAQIDIRKAVETALRNSAVRVIVAHNHPGGVAAPSRDDMDATRQLIKAFSVIGIPVSDHLIFSDSDSLSMAENLNFAPMFL